MMLKFKIQNSPDKVGIPINREKHKINPKFKIQILKQKFCHLYFRFILNFVLCALCFVLYPCYAQELTILYTGETHAMLYPCSCPKERDGGIARRATLIKQLRKTNSNILLLDSGAFFGGGLMDEYTQNTPLDKERTLINLKAIELMKYDALTIGDDEFNFGREFLEETAGKGNLTFLSCNIKSDKLSPFIIKEIAGIKIGIIGLTSPTALPKAGGLEFMEPEIAVKRAVEELKAEKTDIIILLSHLGESDDLKLIKEVKGIDVLIVGGNLKNEPPAVKVDSTLILKPTWQGRRLGKTSLTVEGNKITNYKTEEIRLSDKIADDAEILSILPSCFSDANCKKEGIAGSCQNPGSLNSRCVFPQSSQIKLLIITPKVCLACDTEKVVETLKTTLPGLVVSYLYYPDSQANKLIKELNINTLPAYLLGKEIEKEKSFDNFKKDLEIKGTFYALKPQFSGFSYFLNRNKIKGKIDLFISMYDGSTPELLNAIKDFEPTIHFLATEQGDAFYAARGSFEAEECLRLVCIQKYYPQNFWKYITCRSGSISSSWWEDCLDNLDIGKIRICAKGIEGKSLLRENIQLNKEIGIMLGPTYLVDNQEIFSSKEVPTKEEFKKIFNSQK